LAVPTGPTRHAPAASPWRRALALGLALLAPLGAALAQGPGLLRLESFGPDQGLPQSTVRALANDDQGFLCVATQDGIARFDGHRFEVWRCHAGGGATPSPARPARSLAAAPTRAPPHRPRAACGWAATTAGWRSSTCPTGAGSASAATPACRTARWPAWRWTATAAPGWAPPMASTTWTAPPGRSGRWAAMPPSPAWWPTRRRARRWCST